MFFAQEKVFGHCFEIEKMKFVERLFFREITNLAL